MLVVVKSHFKRKWHYTHTLKFFVIPTDAEMLHCNVSTNFVYKQQSNPHLPAASLNKLATSCLDLSLIKLPYLTLQVRQSL